MDTKEKVVEVLTTVEPKLASGVEFTATTTIADLGIDSLKLVEVGVLLEDSFGEAVCFDDWLDAERAVTDTSRAFALGSLVGFIDKAVGK